MVNVEWCHEHGYPERGCPKCAADHPTPAGSEAVEKLARKLTTRQRQILMILRDVPNSSLTACLNWPDAPNHLESPYRRGMCFIHHGGTNEPIAPLTVLRMQEMGVIDHPEEQPSWDKVFSITERGLLALRALSPEVK